MPTNLGDRLGSTADSTKQTNGATQYTFLIKDRNSATNLAGGSPFCGSIQLATYTAQPSSDALGNALEQLHAQTQQAKLQATTQLMADIDGWVNSWPNTINDPGWDQVKSDQLNQIVGKAETAIAGKLSMKVCESITTQLTIVLRRPAQPVAAR